MLINKDLIYKYNPCKNRMENFVNKYPHFKGSINEFLDLENISYDDKVWVAKKLLTKTQAVEWACLCAESVLHIFENRHPNDPRPRLAIEAARTKDENINSTSNTEAYAYAAAAAAANAAAYAAAAAAAYAAAAANAAAGAYAAAYAAAGADAGANTAANAAARQIQKNKNIELLKIAFTF
jgi:hypothetical protein